jgi:hypothetical protein
VVDAAVGKSALALLPTSLTSPRLPLETLLTTFINELARLAHRGTLIVEDYHVTISPQIHETVTYLVDHLPAMLHLLILSHSTPPFPLARRRAYDDLYELHAADLRFSLAETQTFPGKPSRLLYILVTNVRKVRIIRTATLAHGNTLRPDPKALHNKAEPLVRTFAIDAIKPKANSSAERLDSSSSGYKI